MVQAIGEKEKKIPHICGYLTGHVLVAMPYMPDPQFQKSLIFLCAHDDQGAMGLVINQPLEGLTLADLLHQMDLNAQDSNEAFDMYVGGPLEGSRGFVLHTLDYQQEETLVIHEKFGLTATLDVLLAISKGEGPAQALLILGYAGWTAGQLETELQENFWLHLPADEELVFQTSSTNKWQKAIDTLGVEEVMLTPDVGHA